MVVYTLPPSWSLQFQYNSAMLRVNSSNSGMTNWRRNAREMSTMFSLMALACNRNMQMRLGRVRNAPKSLRFKLIALELQVLEHARSVAAHLHLNFLQVVHELAQPRVRVAQPGRPQRLPARHTHTHNDEFLLIYISARGQRFKSCAVICIPPGSRPPRGSPCRFA